MSFQTLLKKLFAKKSNEKQLTAKDLITPEDLKEVQNTYLTKSKTDIFNMKVRDIAVALKTLNNYCIKKIQKTNSAKNTIKKEINITKLFVVANKSYEYICALLDILADKDEKRQYQHLKEIKNSARIYNPYIDNFQTAFETVNKEIPGALKNSPDAAWQKLMKSITTDDKQKQN